MPLQDGSNLSSPRLPITVPQTSAFEFIGNPLSTARPVSGTTQPRLSIEPQATGTSSLQNVLNGLGGALGGAANSLFDAFVQKQVKRINPGPEQRNDTRGDERDQPVGAGVPVSTGFFADNKSMLIAAGVAVSVLALLYVGTK